MSSDEEFRNAPPTSYLTRSSSWEDLVDDAIRRAVLLRDDLATDRHPRASDTVMLVEVLNMMRVKADEIKDRP